MADNWEDDAATAPAGRNDALRNQLKRINLSEKTLKMFETDEVDPDTVYEVFQAGYTLHERLLRPARVVVAKAPAKPAQPAEAAQVVDESSSAEEKSAPSQEENEGSVDTNEES